MLMISLFRIRLSKFLGNKAFTLLELMFASSILVVVLVGLLYSYVVCFELNEFSRNLTLANNALQAELESIKEIPFDDLNNLDGTTFDIVGLDAQDAEGLVEVYNSPYADLKYVRLVASWRQKSNRIIGEDKNLNGNLENSEDVNNNNVMDSPAELVTLISKING